MIRVGSIIELSPPGTTDWRDYVYVTLDFDVDTDDPRVAKQKVIPTVRREIAFWESKGFTFRHLVTEEDGKVA